LVDLAIKRGDVQWLLVYQRLDCLMDESCAMMCHG